MQISKSEYMMFLKHPAWLWLKKHDKSKLPPVDDNTQAIFDAGNMFEAYAEKLFPDGLRLGFNNYDEYLTLPEATTKALLDGAKTIFQGRFESGEITFICDIIQVISEKVIDLYEIKSSTKAKLEHEFDLAFQMVVLESLGYEVRKISVIHVNNQFIRHGEINPKELVCFSDITDKVKARRDQTKKHIDQALLVAKSPACPDPSPSLARMGSLSDWLEIYRGINEVEEGSIYDLCVPGAKRLAELENLGIVRIVDIPDDFDLTEKQRLQVNATKQNKVLKDEQSLNNFLKNLEFPLYFLDYETLASTVPYFDGIRPYQQLPFQYSIHILDNPGSELRQAEYLHRDSSNPARPLSSQLIKDLGPTGSIIVWYEGFEKARNAELGELIPEINEAMQAINDRVVDLMVPFSSGWYVHKDFLGSASIKHVLPVMVPELSYKTLGIQEGGSAQRLWMEAVLDGKRESEREQILSDLVEYCGLDTLAMVEIYRKLSHI